MPDQMISSKNRTNRYKKKYPILQSTKIIIWISTHRKWKRKITDSFLDAWRRICRRDKNDCRDYLEYLCSDTQQIIVNIDYERSPEAKHPTPVIQLNEAIQAAKKR